MDWSRRDVALKPRPFPDYCDGSVSSPAALLAACDVGCRCRGIGFSLRSGGVVWIVCKTGFRCRCELQALLTLTLTLFMTILLKDILSGRFVLGRCRQLSRSQRLGLMLSPGQSVYPSYSQPLFSRTESACGPESVLLSNYPLSTT